MGVPTLRVFQGGKRKMDYEGKRETSDMKLFFKNLLKTKKGGKRRKNKRKRKTKKKKRNKRRRKGGNICFTKKCRKDRERKKTDKLNKQFSDDGENLRFNLAWEVCSDKTNKNEYDQCIDRIVGKKQTTDEFINSIKLNDDFEKKSKKTISPPPGMRKRSNKINYKNPMYQQAGKRKKKTRKRKSKKRKSRRKNKK